MSFATLLSEAHAAEGLPATGDVLAVGLPLLRQLLDLHQQGLVADFGGLAHVTYLDGRLGVDPHLVKQPARADDAVFARNPPTTASGIVVSERLESVHSGTGAATVTTRDVLFDPDTVPDRPLLVPGYRAWEQLVGHHDQLTDIHLAGLLLVSYATARDLDVDEEIALVATQRRHLLRLNPGLHPVVAGVLSDMIEPDRTLRPTDVTAVIAQLENHRDLPADLDLDAAYEEATAPAGWRPAVLGNLRERVFDLTRRNRAVYFRPTATTVGLTEASVPMMLDVERIRPDDLLTWNDEVAATFAKGSPVSLERWCRFDESPHVTPALDKLISSERKLRAEYGFGRLRLIIAFLRWTDPETSELVNSPLLFLPAELTKKKGVKPQYRLATEEEAELNPDLRHLLDARFGIALPASIDPSPPAIAALVEQLERSVKATDPAVRIEIIHKPRVRLIRRRAQLRIDAYRRRRATTLASSGRWRRQAHSYDLADWRPLGLALYRRFVASPELPLRRLAGAAPRPQGPEFLAAGAEAAVREREFYSSDADDVSRHRWEVDLCAVTLASIGSKRTSLVRDYDQLLADEVTGHGPFDQLFSPDPRTASAEAVAPIGTDQLLVLPADDAQARAVRRAGRGDSFIIQGPPGTGKSQTITNLIAALGAEGKRVLFVCEKRAALDVVANRLDQVGLGHLTAIIHDSQLDRRTFIGHLGETYDAWLDDDRIDAEPERTAVISRIDRDLDRLDAMLADLAPVAGGISARSLIERVSALRAADVAPAADVAVDPTTSAVLAAQQWLDARPGLDRVADALTRAGRRGQLSSHPMLLVAPAALTDPDDGGSVASQIPPLAERVGQATAALGRSLPLDGFAVGQLEAMARDAAALQRAPAARLLIDPTGTVVAQLGADQERQRQLRAVVATLAEIPGRWIDVLSVGDARSALTIAERREGSFLSFLNGGWRAVKSTVHASYRFDQHRIKPTITQVLRELLTHLEAVDSLRQAEAEQEQRWGTTDLDAVAATAADVRDGPLATAAAGPSFDPATVATAAAQLQALATNLVVSPSATLATIDGWAATIEAVPPSLEPALLQWRELRADGASPTSGGALLAALTPGADLPQIERALLEAALERLTTAAGVAGLSSAELMITVERVLAANRELLDLNGRVVAGRARARFDRHLAVASASMAGRSDEDKAFKRSYNAGRKVLENEFRKKMRHRSIRELAGGDAGLVVADLAPIWLMSPLSVSETLPLDPTLFDAVVFDEASQIPVEDAVPTVFRAPQVIVVGDRMQLPPTRFFAAADADDDSELLVDADGHNLLLSLDADSFLTQSDLTLESTLLNWHYRSRHESLIAYSNAAFYDDELATVPDRGLPSGPRSAIVVDDEQAGGANAELVRQRPISFHRLAKGVYRDRRNEAEADYIAELVRGLLLTGGQETIGIVAFSEAQQGQIETALAELAALDTAFAAALEAEQDRQEGDEHVGLFVKNLENVQGDERDIIIMSVCYGPDGNGRTRMNFGPINQNGGERRLNVIFSRAKRHMAIVSSIDGHAISNTHNPGAAHLARFLTYSAAESIGDQETSRATLAALTPSGGSRRSRVERSLIIDQLAQSLRRHGLDVDTDVGRSGFRLDLAIRGDDAYLLGVVVEPPLLTDTTAGRRYLAEAGVLDAFGWPLYRVPVTEWWDDPDGVVNRLLAEVARRRSR